MRIRTCSSLSLAPAERVSCANDPSLLLRPEQGRDCPLAQNDGEDSEHNRISGFDTGFTQALHALEKFLLTGGEDVARLQHQLHLTQQRGRLLHRNPVAGVRAIVNNLLEQDWELWSGIALQSAKESANVLDAGDIAQSFGSQDAFMFARVLHPLIVRFPLFFGGIACKRGSAGIVPGKAFGKGMRLFRPAIADTGAADVRVYTHGLCSSAMPRARP